jgi:hypothetical protein
MATDSDTAALATGASDVLEVPDQVARERLADQLAWYDVKSAHHKRWFQTLKVLQIVIAAVIPVIAALGASVAVAGALGAAIVVLESLQQLFQFQQNWIAYRATAEALKHEKYLYRARAGPYARAQHPAELLAERVEGLVSQEHAAWASSQREAASRNRPDSVVGAGDRTLVNPGR